jgi:Restriction endonuclease
MTARSDQGGQLRRKRPHAMRRPAAATTEAGLRVLCSVAGWLEKGDTFRVGDIVIPCAVPQPEPETAEGVESELFGQILGGENTFDERLHDYVFEHFTEIRNCPVCKNRMSTLDELFELSGAGSVGTQIIIKYCPWCAYWRYIEEFTIVQCQSINDEIAYVSNQEYGFAASAKIQTFAEELPPGVSEEVAQFIRRHEHGWFSISPFQMEQLVASIIRSNHKHTEVIHTGRSGDNGVDVMFLDDGGTKWVVQVKRRQHPDKAEGPAPIRDLIGAAVLHKTKCCALFSNANHFTAAAYATKAKARDSGVRVELIDRGKLNRMIGRVLPQRPWLPLISVLHPTNDRLYQSKYQFIAKHTTDRSPLNRPPDLWK